MERPPELDQHVSTQIGRFLAWKAGMPTPELGAFQTVEKRLVRRQQRGRLALGAVGGVALVALGVGAYWGVAGLLGRAAAPITYRVNGGVGSGEQSVSPPGTLLGGGPVGTPTEVAFSDGTRLYMEPSAHGRVLDLNQHGARVALYAGQARVNVRHRPNARWFFEAGPFEVRVHGTAFSMAWSPAAGRFDLHMESGVVSVAGPIQGGERLLRAGESLSVTVGDGGPVAAASFSAAGSAVAVATPGDDRVPSPPSPGARSPAREPGHVVERPTSHSGGSRRVAWASPEWRARLAEGRPRSIVVEAQRRGLPQVLDAVGAEDLAALADAARYVGDRELARRSMVAQRRRFPGAPLAAEASFLLGRLEDESADGGTRAVVWYDRYLAEAPTGAYVAEALGRKMTVLERAGHRDGAAAIAVDYLRRFPAGSYAHTASALVRGNDRSAPSLRPGP